jgi:hypothetical protein
MSNKIILKKSSVLNKVPLDTDIVYGELALNYADGKLYYKNANNEIDYFSSTEGGGGGGDVVPVTISANAPSSPSAGALWWNSEDANLYVYYNDGDSSQWVGVSRGIKGDKGDPGDPGDPPNFSAVAENIIPAIDVTYDLGSSTNRWRDLYLSGSTINLGGALIQTDSASGAIAFLPQPTLENPNPSGVVVSPSGGISVVETTGGVIAVGAIEEAATSPTAAPVPINITTTPPTDGQALIWDAANAEFVPGNVSSGDDDDDDYANFNTRTYTGDGTTTNYTVSAGLYTSGVIVTENGIVQVPDADYSITGTTLTFTNAPASGVVVQIREMAFINAFSNVWSATSTSLTISKGQKLFVDSSAGPVTVTLPIAAAMGDEVTVVDAMGTAGINNITIARNGHNIAGAAQNLVISSNAAKATLTFYNTTRGWLITNTGLSSGAGGLSASQVYGLTTVFNNGD